MYSNNERYIRFWNVAYHDDDVINQKCCGPLRRYWKVFKLFCPIKLDFLLEYQYKNDHSWKKIPVFVASFMEDYKYINAFRVLYYNAAHAIVYDGWHSHMENTCMTAS